MALRFAAAWAVALAICLLLPVAGSQAAPSLSLNPLSWDFGARDPGNGPSDPVTFTLTNTGDVAIHISSAGVGWFGPVGQDPALFQISEIGCFDPDSLLPAESCTVAVSFNPSTPGPKEGLVGLSGYPADSACQPPYCQPPQVGAWSQLTGMGIGPYVDASNAPPGPPPWPLRPVRVVLVRHPNRLTTKRQAAFWFRSTRAVIGFVCRLDGRRERPCRSPLRVHGLKPGAHRLLIAAVDSEGRKIAARLYRWRVRAASDGRRKRRPY